MKIKRGKYRRAVFIVIYVKDKDGKIEYLILRRKHHWIGWEFSKGGMKWFEPKRLTARREAGEESGLKIIKINRFNYKGRYRYSKELQDRKGIIGQTFTLFSAEAKKGRIKLDKKEHSGFRWMNFKQAVKSVKFPNQKKSLRIVDSFLNRK